jgi:diacylglycerol O-acyltransferase
MPPVTDALSPTDRSSLAAERGPVNMAMVGVVLLERGPGLNYDALCARVEERIHLLPRYRQRLQEPALGLVNPVWADDEHFDVRWHVRQATLPAPGTEVELAALVAREAARRMDRSRPLWELHLVEGLDRERAAVIVKMHHAVVDGVGAVGIAAILLDPGPEPLPVDAPADEWAPRPYALREHLTALAARPVTRGQRLVLQATSRLFELTPRTAASELGRATELVAELARSRPSAPELPLNRPISANRAYALTRAPLAAVKAAGKAAGGTVNDTILAVVAGMLARYLARAGVDVTALERDPVALVPVSIRRDGEDGGGNRISVVFVDLPAGEPSVARRISLVHERMTAIKDSAKIAAGALTVDMSGFAPPLVSSAIARATGGARAFNLVVSNVPGPQLPLYLGGARVLGLHPAVPLNPADQGLAVGVFSYDGQVCFGLTADRELDPPVEVAAAALDEAVAELAR